MYVRDPSQSEIKKKRHLQFSQAITTHLKFDGITRAIVYMKRSFQ